jgi:hypothetical protein
LIEAKNYVDLHINFLFNMPDTSTSDASTPTRRNWFWGILGIASVAALGIAFSRSLLPKPSKTQALSEWQLLHRIDAELSRSGVDGVEVYLRQRKVVLIAAPEQREQLRRAVEVVQRIKDVELIDALIRDTAVPSHSTTAS